MDNPATSTLAASLAERMRQKRATIGVVGLGYVGLPLALLFAQAGFPVLGFDIDRRRVEHLNRGDSLIGHISSAPLLAAIEQEKFEATHDLARLGEPDVVLICVPTPLTAQREPDLSFVTNTAKAIAKVLRPGQFVVLESTTYPGTTTGVVKPILEADGLVCSRDFFLAFSAEREDPGNPDHGTHNIPKVVGGEGDDALMLGLELYGAIVPRTVPVSSPATAEAVKLTENIFRSVNIALVNELKVIYDAMGIDIWEVIDAAKTKPFGFMPFYPGPGLGGHCIPVDPFYLTWKAREFNVTTRFIELSGQINSAMPRYVVDRLAEALDRRFRRGLNGSRILILGVAYKKNVEDTREAPAFVLFEMLEDRGAVVDYHDPYVPVLPNSRNHPRLAGRRSVPLSGEVLGEFDAVLIATDHDAVDYRALARQARLVVDTRNACARAGSDLTRVVKA